MWRRLVARSIYSLNGDGHRIVECVARVSQFRLTSAFALRLDQAVCHAARDLDRLAVGPALGNNATLETGAAGATAPAVA